MFIRERPAPLLPVSGMGVVVPAPWMLANAAAAMHRVAALLERTNASGGVLAQPRENLKFLLALDVSVTRRRRWTVAVGEAGADRTAA